MEFPTLGTENFSFHGWKFSTLAILQIRQIPSQTLAIFEPIRLWNFGEKNFPLQGWKLFSIGIPQIRKSAYQV